MELTTRLRIIADYVKQDAVIADVGTDHAYLPIYLAKKGVIKKAYAADINKGPIEKAKENIKKYQVEGKIETVLSDGLVALRNKAFDTLIIAGMGGMLMKRILEDSCDKLKSLDHLILSPHQDVDKVREVVHQLGFKIVNEDFIKEENKYYVFVVCEKGNDKKYNTCDYKYGRILIEHKNQILKEYLEKKIITSEKILKHLENTGRPADDSRVVELHSEINEVDGVIKWLI